jgi:hypothetical protein
VDILIAAYLAVVSVLSLPVALRRSRLVVFSLLGMEIASLLLLDHILVDDRHPTMLSPSRSPRRTRAIKPWTKMVAQSTLLEDGPPLRSRQVHDPITFLSTVVESRLGRVSADLEQRDSVMLTLGPRSGG